MCIGSVGVEVDVHVHVCAGVYRGDAFAAPMYRAAPASARPGLYQLICTAVFVFSSAYGPGFASPQPTVFIRLCVLAIYPVFRPVTGVVVRWYCKKTVLRL